MKVISSKPKGQRILKCLKLIHTNHKGENTKHKRPFHIEPVENGWSLDEIMDKKNPVPELEMIFKETIGKDLNYF